MSSLSDLPQWTPEHAPQYPSDLSDSDELDGSEDNQSTGAEDMGNNLASEYDCDLALDIPSQRHQVVEGPSSIVECSAARLLERVGLCKQPESNEASSQSHSMDDSDRAAFSNQAQRDVDQGSDESRNSNGPLPLTKCLSSGPRIVDANTSSLTLTRHHPFTNSQKSPSSFTPLVQRFPLSPPRLSQSLSPSVLEHNSSDESNDSEVDDLPRIEQLIALTQPNQQASQSRNETKRPSMTGPHNINCSRSPSSPIKRQMSNSPGIPSQPPHKKRRMMNKEPETPVRYHEVADSSSDEQPPEVNKVKCSMSSQRPPRKLKKKASLYTVETPTSTGVFQNPSICAKSYQKHLVYWHLDGNIRVKIGRTCFQLHRSILARQSKWFENQFNPREPETISHNTEEPYDLTDLDITADDFEELLRALDDTHACFQGELPFSKLNSLLRVSTTLGFTTIEKYASNALSAMWSADLTDVGINKIECPIESLALARQCALFSVIKRTLYELVRLSNFGQTKVIPGNVSVASMVRLGSYDKDLLLTARERLGIAWREALDVDRFPICIAQQGVVDDAGGLTENTPTCAATNHVRSLVAHHEIIKEYGILGYEYDPVNGLQVLAAAPWKEKGFCQACVEQRRNYWLNERERLWRKLDEWFEV